MSFIARKRIVASDKLKNGLNCFQGKLLKYTNTLYSKFII